jgi:hypothetical protein
MRRDDLDDIRAALEDEIAAMEHAQIRVEVHTATVHRLRHLLAKCENRSDPVDPKPHNRNERKVTK